MSQTVEIGTPAKRVGLHKVFAAFLKASLCSFGGGLVRARRVVVEQTAWMDEQEFAETLTLCQLMPGPNILGVAVCAGAKLRGTIAAITAVAGFILVPWTVGLSLGALVLQNAHVVVVRNILGGLSAAAAGLLIATGIRRLPPHRARPTALLFAGLAFVGMVFVKLPLLVVLLALALLSVAATAVGNTRT